MLIVILNILKVIGYIILFILASFLISFLVVFFVPVRYKAVGGYKNKEANILIKISYLFHIFSITFSYKDKKPLFVYRLFGIKIKIPKRKKRRKSNNSSQDNKSAEDEDKVSSEENGEEAPQQDELFSDRLEAFKKNLNYYSTILKSDYFKETVLVCKRRMGKLSKCFLPQKGKIVLWLGFENAGTTGEILGLYRALYSYIGNVVILNSYYDRECTDVEFNVKGRILSFFVIYNYLCILNNKNFIKLIRKLKHKPK